MVHMDLTQLAGSQTCQCLGASLLDFPRLPPCRRLAVARCGFRAPRVWFEALVRVKRSFVPQYGALFPMDNDRKYRQNGYMDSDRDTKAFAKTVPNPGPRPPIDVTGPRLPRLVQHVAASRCFNCSTALPPGYRICRELPEVQRGAALLQTVHALRAVDPVPMHEADPGADPAEGQDEQVHPVCAAGDRRPRRHVERRVRSAAAFLAHTVGGPPAPRNADDARNAFDRLFKKT